MDNLYYTNKNYEDLPNEIWKEFKPNYFVSNMGVLERQVVFNV